ncbi:prepilin-type N-terminal cleavage/methylation domain-containing protein [Desulfohalotomaculum tongense]|uniref:type IV pilus modification PilV family protein n=1 Tax=Desulforadius tongensis TaxID=1216062 RepID=UPI00195AB0E0|nr:type II secretion system protein [Desulforadius tongensis]MBM7854505.1 prepilin-type N-terminal cleavage/methylation domain-containing protein [Desulforadius tongensis]
MKILINPKGFTLLEVMTALAIITLVVVPLSEMFLHSKRGAVSNWRTIQAINMAQGILETVKAKDYSRVNSTVWQDIANAPSAENWSYRLEVTNESYNLKKVTVILRYPENGKQKELSLTMLKGLR